MDCITADSDELLSHILGSNPECDSYSGQYYFNGDH